MFKITTDYRRVIPTEKYPQEGYNFFIHIQGEGIEKESVIFIEDGLSTEDMMKGMANILNQVGSIINGK